MNPTPSSTSVILLQPAVHSSQEVTDRSLQHAAPHLLPRTLDVSCHFSPSSSPSYSPSSCSDHGLVVDISDGVFHSHLKAHFSQILSIHSLYLLTLIFWYFATHFVVTASGSVGECGRWLLGTV